MSKRTVRSKKKHRIKADNKRKPLILASKEEIEGLYNLITTTQNVKDIEFKAIQKENGNTINLFSFKLNEQKFKVILSENTPKHKYHINEKLLAYHCWMHQDYWIIQIEIGRYKPLEIINIANDIHNNTVKYNSKRNLKEIDRYIKAHIHEDYNDEAEDNLVAMIFAKEFLGNYNINDLKSYIAYIVLEKIFIERLKNGIFD